VSQVLNSKHCYLNVDCIDGEWTEVPSRKKQKLKSQTLESLDFRAGNEQHKVVIIVTVIVSPYLDYLFQFCSTAFLADCTEY